MDTSCQSIYQSIAARVTPEERHQNIVDLELYSMLRTFIAGYEDLSEENATQLWELSEQFGSTFEMADFNGGDPGGPCNWQLNLSPGAYVASVTQSSPQEDMIVNYLEVLPRNDSMIEDAGTLRNSLHWKHSRIVRFHAAGRRSEGVLAAEYFHVPLTADEFARCEAAGFPASVDGFLSSLIAARRVAS